MSDDRRRRHERRQSALAAEVGELPPVENPDRRRACAISLSLFAVTYFPESAGRNLLSPAHFAVLDQMEACILRGGCQVNAVFRGFAKTTLTEIAAIWAAFCAYRRYVVVMGGIHEQADEMLDSISREIESNELLAEDFPEICHPFHHLEGKPQKCRAQTFGGEPTHILMRRGVLVFPTLRLAGQTTEASGIILRASGFNPPRRGMKFKLPSGENVRPDLFILDDIQTDQTAANPQQVHKQIHRYLYKAVLGSVGHDQEAALILNATPIEPGDVVEELLNHDLHPSFSGLRIPLVQEWSARHDEFWLDAYRKARHRFDPTDAASRDGAHAAANALYLAHQLEADRGCRVTWPHMPLPPGTSTAIQHAYNRLLDLGPDKFQAEYQMQPAGSRPTELVLLTPADLAARVNGWPRSEHPPEATVFTAGVDVHHDVMFWILVGWTQLCQGFIVDYGTFPEQPGYFSKRTAKRKLHQRFPGKTTEEQITLGLEHVFRLLSARERIDKICVDRGDKPNEVMLAIRRMDRPQLIQPCLGISIDARRRQIPDYQQRPGYVIGENWFLHNQILSIDVNFWKTWLHQRWLTPIGNPGGLSLFGHPGTTDHRLVTEHLTAETPRLDEGGEGIRKIVWENSRRQDNHWLDCLVYAAAAASLLGCSVDGQPRQQQLSARQRALAAARRRGLLG